MRRLKGRKRPLGFYRAHTNVTKANDKRGWEAKWQLSHQCLIWHCIWQVVGSLNNGFGPHDLMNFSVKRWHFWMKKIMNKLGVKSILVLVRERFWMKKKERMELRYDWKLNPSKDTKVIEPFKNTAKRKMQKCEKIWIEKKEKIRRKKERKNGKKNKL